MILTIGIPFSRWGALPFVQSPVQFPNTNIVHPSSNSEETVKKEATRAHPFDLARTWLRQMGGDHTLSKAKIAARHGLSRARVTQIMNLLKLPAEIKAVLAEPPAPLEIHSFSERSLRRILENNDGDSQLGDWRHFLQKLRNA